MEHGPIKVGMIILMQSDLPKAVQFYESLSLKKSFHLENQWAEFDLGCVKLGLCPTSQSFEAIRTGVVLETFEDLQSLYTTLKAQGVEFLSEPVVAPHGIMVPFKDPSGNVLDLYQPTPEKYKEFIKETAAKAESK